MDELHNDNLVLERQVLRLEYQQEESKREQRNTHQSLSDFQAKFHSPFSGYWAEQADKWTEVQRQENKINLSRKARIELVTTAEEVSVHKSKLERKKT